MAGCINVVYCLFTYMTLMSFFFIWIYKLSNGDEMALFKKTLTNNQKIVYDEIKNERMINYEMGLLIGIIIAYIYSYFSAKTTACSYAGLAFLIAALYYMLIPKSKYMVNYLTDMDQVKLYNDVYVQFRFMTNVAYLVGFILFIM